MNPALTELDRLLTDDQRRVSVADHGKFHESLAGPPKLDPELEDFIEELRADRFEMEGSR